MKRPNRMEATINQTRIGFREQREKRVQCSRICHVHKQYVLDDGHCPPENRQSTGDAIPWKRVNIDDIKSEWKIPIQK